MSGDVYQIACVPGKKKEVLEFLRKTELKIYGSEDFEYSILEEDVKQSMPRTDKQALFIPFCLYCDYNCRSRAIRYSLFDIRQRYREIAIRKVNGATFYHILQLFFREYFILVTLGNVFALQSATWL